MLERDRLNQTKGRHIKLLESMIHLQNSLQATNSAKFGKKNINNRFISY